MKSWKVIVLILVFTISMSVQSFAIEDPSINEGIFIDSSIMGTDRTELLRTMQKLDKGADRENVLLVFEDGHFTANKKELLDEFRAQNKDKIGADGKLILKKKEKKKEAKEVAALAYTNPSNTCTHDNSGPFRRVLSTAGYSRLVADIYLPGKALNEVYMAPNDPAPAPPNDDKGYIYSGITTTAGSQVDMGVALNYTPGSASTMETWGMFIGGEVSSDANYGNYKMGQTVYFKFYVPANNQVALYINGVDKAGVANPKTLVANISLAKNITTGGSGMMVKRITSIGQTNEDMTTGSYLKNVNWTNVKIGTVSGQEVLQTGNTTSTVCGHNTNNVLVDYTSASSEKVWVKAGILP